MSGERIVVVEDEESIIVLLTYNLTRNGYQVNAITSGEEALKSIRSEPPDLVLLDLMLPGLDGLDVCKALRNDPGTASIPVIMLTARGEESDIVIGLELGADDYVTKPFSPRLLLARIKSLLRRSHKGSTDESNLISCPDLVIDHVRREVRVLGEAVALTYTEFSVLEMLAIRPGRVFTRNQIIDAVRGGNYPVTDRSVDVQIVGLRKKLGPCGSYIETIRGVGYRFKEF
ncbi:response regulator transcription factor [bacterium]|nr:response regulator transcription factor [bacterium]